MTTFKPYKRPLLRRLLPNFILRWRTRLHGWLEHAYRNLCGRGKPLALYVNGSDFVVARSPWEARRIVMWDSGLLSEEVDAFELAAPDLAMKVHDEDAPQAPPEIMSPADIVEACGEPRYWWSREW